MGDETKTDELKTLTEAKVAPEQIVLSEEDKRKVRVLAETAGTLAVSLSQETSAQAIKHKSTAELSFRNQLEYQRAMLKDPKTPDTRDTDLAHAAATQKTELLAIAAANEKVLREKLGLDIPIRKLRELNVENDEPKLSEGDLVVTIGTKKLTDKAALNQSAIVAVSIGRVDSITDDPIEKKPVKESDPPETEPNEKMAVSSQALFYLHFRENPDGGLSYTVEDPSEIPQTYHYDLNWNSSGIIPLKDMPTPENN